MIRVKCPQCGKELHVDDKYAGKMGNCLHCKQKIKVPSGNVWKEEIGMEEIPNAQIEAFDKDSAFAGPYPSPPKIPAKKEPRTRSVVLGVIAALSFIALIDAKLNYESRSESSAQARKMTTTAAAPVFTVSARQLFGEYNANEVAAELKYYKKIIVVTGTVQNIKINFMGTPIITLDSGSILGVECSFPDNQQVAISRISKGQSVRIRGEVSGKILGSVLLKNCSI